MKNRHPHRIHQAVSEIGFGAWQLNNPSFHTTTEEEAVALVHRALDEGVTLFDTAPNYGEGNSERTLGIALKNVRDKVFINTKFGHSATGGLDFSVEALATSLEGSLSRLDTDYVDGLILHNPGIELLDGRQPIYERLKDYQKQGVIRHYGVSIDTAEELQYVLDHNDVDIIEVMFSIVHQGPRIYFDEVRRRGILLLIKVPLDSGWLSGKYTIDTTFTDIRSRWTTDVKRIRLDIVDKVKAIFGTDAIAQDSLRFILAHDAVGSVIPGMRDIHQLMSNVGASDHPLDDEVVQQLYDLYDRYISTQYTPW
jgi:aryl-alcohol dehydrogenase-like predicted oxidoreductase